LTALLLAGCAAHRDEHAAPRHVSIKDKPEAVTRPAPVANKMPAARVKVEKAEKSAPPTVRVAAAPSMPPAAKIVAEAGPVPVEKGRVKSAANEAEKPIIVNKPLAQPSALEPQPAAPKTVAVTPKAETPAIVVRTINSPSAAATNDIAKTSKPVEKVAEKPAPQPTLVMPAHEPAATETARPTTDARRGNTVIAANSPAIAPAASPSVTFQLPAQAQVVEAPAKQQVAIALQPKPKAPAAATDLPGQPKLAALSEDQRVRDTIARANDHLQANRLINARALLQDAARGSNGELLMALAGTYDPVQLRQTHPRLVRSADPLRALELYQQAAQNGASASLARIEALRAATVGVAKQ
jgi:hypothetical protein